MAQKEPNKSAPKSDERHIVGKDRVDVQDIEDQVLLFWEKNKGLIIGGVAFVIAVFIGYQGFKLYQSHAEARMQAAYQDATSAQEKAAWAESAAGKPLAGLAFKELGDQAYAEGDLAQAERYYRQAAASAERPVSDAATIALAATLIEQDKASEARTLLQPIANDSQAPNQAEAQFRLAQLASDQGDAETARSLIDAIDEQHFFWKSRALSLERALPEASA